MLAVLVVLEVLITRNRSWFELTLGYRFRVWFQGYGVRVWFTVFKVIDLLRS